MKKRRVSKFRCDMSRFHVTLAAGHDFRIKDLEITFFLSGQVKVVQGKSSPTPEEAEARNQPHFLGDDDEVSLRGRSSSVLSALQ
jgi:hypothetical protein